MAEILINEANNCDNILSGLNVKVLKIAGNPVDLQSATSSELTQKQLDEILQLTKDNMELLYETSSWGWNITAKLKEFRHENARFLILKIDGKLIGFCHFRFDYGSDESESCVYCYELQVADDYQRLGIGTYLMDILKLLAIRFRMYKVMLTVFRHNRNAIDFYVNKFGFRVDKSSPSKFDQLTDYEIFSLKINKRLKLK